MFFTKKMAVNTMLDFIAGCYPNDKTKALEQKKKFLRLIHELAIDSKDNSLTSLVIEKMRDLK